MKQIEKKHDTPFVKKRKNTAVHITEMLCAAAS